MQVSIVLGNSNCKEIVKASPQQEFVATPWVRPCDEPELARFVINIRLRLEWSGFVIHVGTTEVLRCAAVEE